MGSAPELCRAVRDAVSSGHSIAEGWASRLRDIKFNLDRGKQEAKEALDSFNSTLGFGKSNCAEGGSCSDAFGKALGAVIAAGASDGTSELGGAEGILRSAEEKIGNILEDHLTSRDLEAASRESNGEVLLKEDGTPWNHREEVAAALRRLGNQARRLQRALKKSGLSDSQNTVSTS